MSRISAVNAWEVFDSRGSPTVAVGVTLDSGDRGHSMVPSGASTGSHEAIELRDGEPERLGGRGVLRAIERIEGEISTAVLGLDVNDQSRIDLSLIHISEPTRPY